MQAKGEREKSRPIVCIGKEIRVKIEESIFAIDFLSVAYRFIIGPNNTEQ